MTESDFELELRAWMDGELPPDRTARVESRIRSSAELMARVTAERAFDARVRRTLLADAAAAPDFVRAVVATARAETRPAGRLVQLRWGALRAVAAVLVFAMGGMWWFCIPPFECAYMQALEAASEDPKATPCDEASAFWKRCGMPERTAGLVAAEPAARTQLDVHGLRLDGVRQDYVRDDLSALRVVICASKDVRPSIRRKVERDGLTWWIADIGSRRVVAFDHGDDVCAVTGRAGDESVYAAARALRSSFR
jgi:hypothetical protein